MLGPGYSKLVDQQKVSAAAAAEYASIFLRPGQATTSIDILELSYAVPDKNLKPLLQPTMFTSHGSAHNSTAVQETDMDFESHSKERRARTEDLGYSKLFDHLLPADADALSAPPMAVAHGFLKEPTCSAPDESQNPVVV